MKIYLLDRNPTICYCWKLVFRDVKVEIVQDNFEHFMDNHKTIQCIVSPANSRGEMYGGYDKAISDYFGWDLTKIVQEYIKDNYKDGLQPVGTSLIFNIPKTKKKLIHTPTMVFPMPIANTNIVYTCMKSTLECALANNIKSIVIPAFGGATGHIEPEIIAQEMYKAYKDVLGDKYE